MVQQVECLMSTPGRGIPDQWDVDSRVIQPLRLVCGHQLQWTAAWRSDALPIIPSI